MLSSAEAKFLGNSAIAFMALQRLNSQATVIQTPIDAQWVALLSKSTYQQK